MVILILLEDLKRIEFFSLLPNASGVIGATSVLADQGKLY